MLDTRFATTDDLRFVRDSWFESFRRGGFAPDIGFDVFQEGQRNLIHYLTEKPLSPVVVAFAEKTPDEILSWICFHGPVVHYVYTKSAYRKMGLADNLLAIHGPFKFFTHPTRAGMKLAKKLQLRYNPYLTMKGNP